ncbi:MAG: hypothetical protein CME70_10370 [Halobacteriovorax sp.]|nr:hypothetical protein [Halobacteriovorax sp.]|tara:strand:+ start:141671 stop:141871 length:201 start_codon:yes stop_codon:yes gene_type:complete
MPAVNRATIILFLGICWGTIFNAAINQVERELDAKSLKLAEKEVNELKIVAKINQSNKRKKIRSSI